MAENKKPEESLQRTPEADPDHALVLDEGKVLQTAGLNETQVQELRMQHARGMIDLHKKALELNVDVGALDATLESAPFQIGVGLHRRPGQAAAWTAVAR
ncbi:MAG: hypothetical protein IH936_14860 [Acidobacteria bacterium]|nr:hypothetical protein [Acidobacteriota bacterium]